MEQSVLLNIKDLKVVYTQNKKEIHAVNGVSFSLKRGETLGLVGETGAGKTTIAKSILRILPMPPARVDGGEIYFNDADLLKKTEDEMLDVRGKRIAMIFQDPMTALNPLQTVGDQILEVVLLHNAYGREEGIRHVKEMLELVGIPRERYAEYPHQFSGGMKQRVVIAMALACDPELLLADEPTTALDVTIQAQVLDLINRLQEEYNTSMILITHDLGVVAETCDNVAVIYAGEIVEFGSKQQIFKNPSHPYTLGLFESLPSMTSSEKWLKPIEGTPPDPANLPKGCKFHPRCPYATEECAKTAPKNREVEPGHFCLCSRRKEERT